jgi:hypothetical protein
VLRLLARTSSVCTMLLDSTQLTTAIEASDRYTSSSTAAAIQLLQRQRVYSAWLLLSNYLAIFYYIATYCCRTRCCSTYLLNGTASKLTPAGGGSAGITVCCEACMCPLFVPYRVSIPLSRVSIPPVPLLLLLLPVLSLLPPTAVPTAAPTAAENDSALALC